MKFRSVIPFVLLLILSHFTGLAQRITYSEVDNKDNRSLQFEIIGKVNNNFLIFKNARSTDFAVSVYDNDMKLKDRVKMSFLPDRTINVDFVAYPDFAYVIYQYQRRGILYCMAAKMDGDGKIMGTPVELDTTALNVFADNKIYTTINSEDKQKIMIFKIQRKNETFHFTTLLFNNQLTLLRKSRTTSSYDERRDIFSDFYVDNEGDFVYAKSTRLGTRDLIAKLTLVTKPADRDSFAENDIDLNGQYLDEVKIKVDNINRRYLINSFFYKIKRGNIDGLYTGIWDKQTNSQIVKNAAVFSDSLKQEAKTEGPFRQAMNDFFIRNVILKKDGGFILATEDYYTQSRGNPWNRMDFLYGYPYMSSYNYYMYSPSSYWYYYRPRNGYGSGQRYYYDNIVVMSVDKSGRLEWSNVIHKSQFDDDYDDLLSFSVIPLGGELHFLFNEVDRRDQLLSDQTVTPDGQVKLNPTLRSLDKGYSFMPKFGKQVSSRSTIIPCAYRNSIIFAKLDY